MDLRCILRLASTLGCWPQNSSRIPYTTTVKMPCVHTLAYTCFTPMNGLANMKCLEQREIFAKIHNILKPPLYACLILRASSPSTRLHPVCTNTRCSRWTRAGKNGAWSCSPSKSSQHQPVLHTLYNRSPFSTRYTIAPPFQHVVQSLPFFSTTPTSGVEMHFAVGSRYRSVLGSNWTQNTSRFQSTRVTPIAFMVDCQATTTSTTTTTASAPVSTTAPPTPSTARTVHPACDVARPVQPRLVVTLLPFV